MRAKPLGHNAFAAERAGVPEDDHAVTAKVLVEGNPAARAVEKLGQCAARRRAFPRPYQRPAGADA
jgi:hypothetical protein